MSLVPYSLRSAPFRRYSSCAAPIRARLERPPIAYHLLRTPIPYDIGLQLQESIVDTRAKWRTSRNAHNSGADGSDDEGDVVLLLEHTPTYTTGRRDLALTAASTHPEQAKMLHSGAEFHQTKRGGQVTYHGMGQLVGYPILDIGSGGMSLSARCYVDYIQSILAAYARATLSDTADVLAPHPNGHVGVFVGPQAKVCTYHTNTSRQLTTPKLASIGIQIRHRITSHGFAINVTREPIPWFDLVTACGLNDVQATSLQGVLSGQRLPPTSATTSLLSVEKVASDMMPFFGAKFGRRMAPLQDVQQTGSASRGEDIWSEIRGLIQRAEDAARQRVTLSSLPRRPL